MKEIGLKEILEIIDKKFGYAQDPDIIRLLRENNIQDKYLHLLERRYFNRFLNYYAREHGCDEYSEIVRINDRGTKGALYDYKDIMKFLRDPKTMDRINKVLHSKTIDAGPYGLIPKCVYLDYMEEKLGVEEIYAGGYSRYQLELMSVPEEYLEEANHDYEIKKKDLLKQLEKIQMRQNGVKEELQRRKNKND